MRGYWTPDARALTRERQRYLSEHYSGSSGPSHGHLLDPNREVKTASWVGTELAPALDELREQGYDLSDMANITEVLESMGEYDMAQFIREQQHVEWQQFVEESLSAEAELAVEGPDIEKIYRAARAADLQVADIWESRAETFEAPMEFYSQHDAVRAFADALTDRFPTLLFEVDQTDYQFPTMWIRERQSEATTATDSTSKPCR